jgi:hypothetical protein
VKPMGYGAGRSPLGFSGNVWLEITAPNLVVRIQIIGRFTDNPDPHRGQPDPDEPIAPAQRGPRRRLVPGERLAQGEVLKSELAVAAAEERVESEQVEQRVDHGTAIGSRSEPKDQPLVWPDGVLAKDSLVVAVASSVCHADATLTWGWPEHPPRWDQRWA